MIQTTTIRVSIAAALFALTASAHADQKTVPYNIGPNECTKPIAIPANNKPVILAGTNITPGDRGEGQVTLLRANQTDPLLHWSGNDYYHGVEKGSSSTAHDLIMYLDAGGLMDVQTAASLHLEVCSADNFPGRAFGYLTFFY